MPFFVVQPRVTDAAEFIRFWSDRYDYVDADYAKHVAAPLTEEALTALFVWKNGGKLSERKAASVRKNYVAKLDKLHRFLKTKMRRASLIASQVGPSGRSFSSTAGTRFDSRFTISMSIAR